MTTLLPFLLRNCVFRLLYTRPSANGRIKFHSNCEKNTWDFLGIVQTWVIYDFMTTLLPFLLRNCVFRLLYTRPSANGRIKFRPNCELRKNTWGFLGIVQTWVIYDFMTTLLPFLLRNCVFRLLYTRPSANGRIKFRPNCEKNTWDFLGIVQTWVIYDFMTTLLPFLLRNCVFRLLYTRTCAYGRIKFHSNCEKNTWGFLGIVQTWVIYDFMTTLLPFLLRNCVFRLLYTRPSAYGRIKFRPNCEKNTWDFLGIVQTWVIYDFMTTLLPFLLRNCVFRLLYTRPCCERSY